MNNLQNFIQYNEGRLTDKVNLVKWIKNKFNSGAYDSTMLNILNNNIKPHFRYSRLMLGHTAGESKCVAYMYKDHLYNIKVSLGGGEFNTPPFMYLNDENITNKINKSTLEEYYNFFDKMYYDEYIHFKGLLDDVIEKKDFSRFAEIYNSSKESFRDRYKKERPENEDIIDGMNVGLFSLKN